MQIPQLVFIIVFKTCKYLGKMPAYTLYWKNKIDSMMIDIVGLELTIVP